jgi:hypothetical protein
VSTGLHRVLAGDPASADAVKAALGELLGLSRPLVAYIVVTVDADAFLEVNTNASEQWAWQRVLIEAVRMAGLEDAPELPPHRMRAVLAHLLDALVIQRGGVPACGGHCGGGTEGIRGHCPEECCHGRPLRESS